MCVLTAALHPIRDISGVPESAPGVACFPHKSSNGPHRAIVSMCVPCVSVPMLRMGIGNASDIMGFNSASHRPNPHDTASREVAHKVRRTIAKLTQGVRRPTQEACGRTWEHGGVGRDMPPVWKPEARTDGWEHRWDAAAQSGGDVVGTPVARRSRGSGSPIPDDNLEESTAGCSATPMASHHWGRCLGTAGAINH